MASRLRLMLPMKPPPLLWVLLIAVYANGDNSVAFFESKIRPVLVKQYYECHSVESGKSKGGLTLDTKQGIRSGGDTGLAAVPGDATKSLMLAAIKHSDPDLEMPPKKARLPEAVITDFEAWIKTGAAGPRESAHETVERPPVDVASGRKFWSYQKPQQVAGTIDGFIRGKLKEQGLEPATAAEPVVALRRLYLDLIGLPPTPEQAAAFSKEKLEATVDDLLRSPRFGSRWGRHWLDVARYAESNGRVSNLTLPHAWRYRDYVIDAVNADVPFNRFVTEQIAGNLLPAQGDAERAPAHRHGISRSRSEGTQ